MAKQKSLNCQELIDHVENWSLAGNVKLLRHMEEFVETLFDQANQTENNLSNLLQDLDSADIQLDIVRNQFLGLQNTQFIESRVYEDDETIIEPFVETTEQNLDEINKKEVIKSAVSKGLEVLDKYYDFVSIPESDSETDEVDFTSYILRENDFYIHRPLPYIIGTSEWHTKWHAGLVDSSDENEDVGHNGCKSAVEDEFSDTDSGSNLPVANRLDVCYDVASQKNHDYDGNDIGNEEFIRDSSVTKVPAISVTFAEQLAAKLGDVLTDPDVEVNKRPIQQTSPFVLNQPSILSLDAALNSQRLFSGEEVLFDNDDDDDDYDRPPPIIHTKVQKQIKVPNLFDDDEDDDDHHIPIISQSKKADNLKRVGDLFDDTDSEGEFLGGPSQNIVNSQPQRQGPVFLPKEPPSLSSKTISGKNLPVGAVNVLGNFLPKRQDSLSSDEKIAQCDPVENKTAMKSEEKVLRLFEDTDDLFKDDIFNPSALKEAITNLVKPPALETSQKSFGSLNQTPINIFDDDFEDIEPPPLSTTKEKVPDIGQKKKTRNLFDESSCEEDDDIHSSFSIPDIKKITSNLLGGVSSSSLFDDVDIKEDLWTVEDNHQSESVHDNKSEVKSEDVKNDIKIVESPEINIPGKLKHSLNINVATLLPHADITTRICKPEEIAGHVLTSEKNFQSNGQQERALSDPDRIQVLSSVTKTRAKIPSKRKPSTREGRRAALAVSQSIDHQLTASVERQGSSEQTNQVTKPNLLIAKEVESKITKLETTKEDYLGFSKEGKDLSTNLFDDIDESFITKVDNSSFYPDNQTYHSQKAASPKKQLIVDKNDDDWVVVPPAFDNNKLQQKTIAKKANVEKEIINFFDDDSADLFDTNVGNVGAFDVVPPIHKDLFTSLFNEDEQGIVSYTNKKTTGLFAGFEDEDDLFDNVVATTSVDSKIINKSEDLFSTNAAQKVEDLKKTNNVSRTKKSIGLFGDCDDDSYDLFSSRFNPPKSSGITPTNTIPAMNKNPRKMQSIFGDDDDDDMFNTEHKKPSKQTLSKLPKEINIQANKSKISSASATKPTSDPLAALLADD